MAKIAVKRDGTKEPFDPEKIRKSVEFAVRNSGNSIGQVEEIISRASAAALKLADAEKEEIETSKMAKAIFKELEKIAPPAALVWKKYEDQKNRE